jgi:Kef-type K+ transport system membrane component KefB
MAILLALFVCVTLAYFFGEIAKFFKFPRIIGQLLAGVIVGIPVLKQVLFDAMALDTLRSLANIGFVLLLFFVGLEINSSKMHHYLRRGVTISIFNMAVPFAAGFFVSRLFGLDVIASLIVSMALSVGAVAVTVDFLEELNILKTAFASVLVSVGAIQDIIQVFVIAAVLAAAKVSVLHSSMSTFFFGIIFFIASVVILKSIIIPFILRTVERERSATSLLTGAFMIALLMASLSDTLGLGSLIGALTAGIIVRQILLGGTERRPWEEHEIAKSMHTLTFGVFAPLFFVYIGLQTNFFERFDPLFGATLVIIVLVGSVAGTMIGNALTPASKREKSVRAQESILLGYGLATKGDADVIIAAIALQNQLISQTVFTSLVFMSITTTLLAIVLFRLRLKKECDSLRLCRPTA